MAVSEALSLGALTLADVAGGLALSSGAGWNQTADDWRFFIEQGHAVGFRTPSGTVVATAAAIVYSGGLGWISMVLVAPAWRHRGLASLLVENCIQRLRSAHITPVLDATPAGEPVYRHLGIRAGSTRAGSARSRATTSTPAPAASPSACTRRSSRSARPASTRRCCAARARPRAPGVATRPRR